MSNARSPRAATAVQRVALTQLIEEKVNRLDMPALIRLAADLDITLPTKLKGAAATRRSGEPSKRAAQTIDFRGSGIGPAVSAGDGSRLLDVITTDNASSDWADTELLGAGDLADRLKVSRATLDNWRKTKKILGLRKGLRNFVYPARQFDRLSPIEGLDRIADFFPTPEDAWEWLVIPNRVTDDLPPIEQLRAGKIDGVVRAAEGALDYA